MTSIRVGCAGWSISKENADAFPTAGSQLVRYAARFPTVEINSSFYKPHRPMTYARWAESVPDDFKFTVKIPREITHHLKLADTSDVLLRFLSEVENLGKKLGALLVQLPPSLVCEVGVATQFFKRLRSRFAGQVACEPRHESWFTLQAARLLASHQIARVAADPAIVPAVSEIGGGKKTAYYRLHGSPRIYYSSYSEEYLESLAHKLLSHDGADHIWCIFDNTALGAATENAMNLLQRLK
jgi:uncharacterized protein YecE (DUF72 family)